MINKVLFILHLPPPNHGAAKVVEIIKNSKPDYSGIANINFQIESTKNGILKAKKLGLKYCLKTRTDQRIYRHDFILFFLSLFLLSLSILFSSFDFLLSS